MKKLIKLLASICMAVFDSKVQITLAVFLSACLFMIAAWVCLVYLAVDIEFISNFKYLASKGFTTLKNTNISYYYFQNLIILSLENYKNIS